jgi:hypothetical protein
MHTVITKTQPKSRAQATIGKLTAAAKRLRADMASLAGQLPPSEVRAVRLFAGLPNATNACTQRSSTPSLPRWFPLTSAFSTPQGNLSALTASVVTSQGLYKNGMFVTGSFLKNHDQPRFQSVTQDQSTRELHSATRGNANALVRNRVAGQKRHDLNDGIPTLYYGAVPFYSFSACFNTGILRSRAGLQRWSEPCQPRGVSSNSCHNA